MSQIPEIPILKYLFGQNGVVNLIDTTPWTGKACAIQAIADCTFSTLTESDATGTLAAQTLPAGHTIYGQFTAVTLATGKLRVYLAV